MRSLALVAMNFVLWAGPQQDPFFQTNGPRQAPQLPGSLSGRVVDAVTSEPVREAHLMLYGVGAGAGVRSASADPSGQFSASELPPGQYYVQALHPNYPGPLGLPQGGVTAEVLPGKETKGLTVALSPPGVVSGRVLDDGGEPLANCSLMLMQSPMGRVPVQSVAFGQSNDKGEFRLAPVAPDRYVLQAKCQEVLPAENLLSIVGPEGFDPRETWQTAYYPDRPEGGGTPAFGVTAGAEVKVEFHMKPVAVSTVTGVVTAAPGVSWTNPPMLQLLDAEGGGSVQQPASVAMVRGNNTFRFTMVPPGSYRLSGTIQDGVPDNASTAEMPVSVGSVAPPPLAVQFQPSVTITGKVEDPRGEQGGQEGTEGVRIVSGPGGPSPMPNVAPIKGSVTLTPVEGISALGPRAGEVNAQDGTFRVSGLTPGRWRVRYQSYRGPAWVESVQYGDAPAQDQQIEVGQGAAGVLRLVLGGKPPTVKFELKDPPSTSARSNWMVQAVPVVREGGGNQTFVSSGLPGQPNAANSLAPGRYYFLALEQSYGGMVNERALELLIRLVEPTEILPGGEQTVAVKCLSPADVQRVVAEFLTGEAK
ncbi:carboxypeptidase-like regulatory domain-containing protein [uncultured Paludibaculum sp.]|uniref:MSCRAMM family protein n=1 Tax=uncultured Paludibaculum sp. TaxID=1765020 RepID=UPI002AAA9EAA|nr:carboxypeptidase-like regulatory domain-containing protein [uncultured Paludibaculum sp.]